MAYVPLQLPPETPHEINIERVERLWLRPVHAMLRLPIEGDPGLDADCTLVAFGTLCDLIGGVSRIRDEHHLSGPAFKEFLKTRYPWEDEPAGGIMGEHAANIIYELYRCPLTHRLGLITPEEENKKGIGREVQKLKVEGITLREEEIESLERSEERPYLDVPTLRKVQDKILLNLPVFYWGVRKVILTVVRDLAATVASEPSRRKWLLDWWWWGSPDNERTEVTATATSIVAEFRPSHPGSNPIRPSPESATPATPEKKGSSGNIGMG